MWEYVVRHYDVQKLGPAGLSCALDAEGLQDWELVALDIQSEMAVFKRRKNHVEIDPIAGAEVVSL